MKTTAIVLAAATAGVLALANAAQAAAISTLYSTGFNAPTYTDGVLNSGADTTTAGQDGWLTTSGGSTNAITVQNSATNGFVTMTTSGQDVRRAFTPAQTSGSVYLQADINLSAAQSAGDYFIHLGDGGTSNFYARTYAKSSGTGYVLALGTGSGAGVTYGTTVLNFNQTYTILARLDLVSGATNDTGALYVNPTTPDGSGDTAYVAATTIGADASSISAVYLRQGTAASAPTLSLVDNIIVSTSNVPEPTTLAALAGVALVGFRRRRA